MCGLKQLHVATLAKQIINYPSLIAKGMTNELKQCLVVNTSASGLCQHSVNNTAHYGHC